MIHGDDNDLKKGRRANDECELSNSYPCKYTNVS